MVERKFIGYVDVYPNGFSPTSPFASRYSTPCDVVKLYSDSYATGGVHQLNGMWYRNSEPMSPFMQSKFNDAMRDYVMILILEEKQ